MPRGNSPAFRFLLAVGGRPVLKGFPTNFLAGPFYLDAPIANAAATAVDLTLADAWYCDSQVRQAYTPANGGSAKQNFTVSIESIEALIVDGVFGQILTTLKDNLWSVAYPSISSTVGGVTRKFPLNEAITEMIESVFPAAVATGHIPATTAGSRLRPGHAWVLPSPLRVDCSQDALSFITEADAAPGAATACNIKFGRGSIVIPNNADDAGSDAMTESCGGDVGDIISVKQALDARSRYLGVVSASRSI